MFNGSILLVYLTIGAPMVYDGLLGVISGAGVDVLELGIPTTEARYGGPVVGRAICEEPQLVVLMKKRR